MKKSSLIEFKNELPEEFELEELMERLLVLQKIEEGQKQIKEGKSLSEADAKRKLEKLLK